MTDKVTVINFLEDPMNATSISVDHFNKLLEEMHKQIGIKFKLVEDKRLKKNFIWPAIDIYRTEEIKIFKEVEKIFIRSYNWHIMGNPNIVRGSVQRQRIKKIENILDYVPFVLLPTEAKTTIRMMGDAASFQSLIENFAAINNIILHYECPFDLRSSKSSFIESARDYYITKGDLLRFTNKEHNALKIEDITEIFCREVL